MRLFRRGQVHPGRVSCGLAVALAALAEAALAHGHGGGHGYGRGSRQAEMIRDADSGRDGFRGLDDFGGGVTIPRDAGPGQAEAAEAADPTAQIRGAAAAYAKAFNTSDYVALADQWTQRASLVEGGLDLEGRAAIIASLRTWRERHPAAVLEIEVTGVEVLAEPLARVEGMLRFTPQPGGRQVRSRFTSLRVREGATWRLAESVVVPEHATALEGLGWLVGTWSAETARDTDGSRTTIETIYEQPLGPYCIVGRTKIRPPDGDPIETLEVIHADRGSGLVRCWIFDSTGGFGEGLVESDGTGLRKGFAGAPSDRVGGRAARWTQVLTPAGDNRCTMQTIERSIDEVALPDGELLHFRKVR